MIFSRQAVDTAYSYLGMYYNKILSVDLDKDLYFPIKIDDIEYGEIPSGITFSKWVEGFVKSDKFKPIVRDGDEPLNLDKYYNLSYLKSLVVPLTLKYGKVVHGEIHMVETVFLPIGKSKAYVYVRDLTKMAQAIVNDELD